MYCGCLAGEEIIYIKPNGDVGACSYLPIIEGNIRDKKISNIIRDSDLFNTLKGYKGKLKGKCGLCKEKNICGGCRAVSFYNNGDVLSEDPRCLLEVSNE